MKFAYLFWLAFSALKLAKKAGADRALLNRAKKALAKCEPGVTEANLWASLSDACLDLNAALIHAKGQQADAAREYLRIVRRAMVTMW